MPEWPKPAQEPARDPEAGSQNLFRTEALHHHQRPLAEQGKPLRVIPSWLDSAYHLLAVLGVAGLALVGMGSSTEYATGPAVVRLSERIEITARSSGTVESILVSPGDKVTAGQILGRLEQSREVAAVEKLRSELQKRLIERLRNFDGQRSDLGMSALEEEKNLAEARLDILSFRSSHDGTLGDLFLRPGKLIETGQLAFTVISPTRAGVPSISALFPGHFRPLLRPGMPMRLRLEGYRHHSLPLTLEAVSASVVSKEEARAFTAHDASPTGLPGRSAAPGTGYVLVRANLPGDDFEVSGQRYPYFDGLGGTVEVPVRSRRLVTQLLPWFHGVDGG